MALYTVTDWLGLVPVAIGLCFGALGLIQWIKRKKLQKVDPDLLLLGGFYLVVGGVYLLFEALVINCRPVLINGILEVSYPSSTTLLVLCILPTAIMQVRWRVKQNPLCTILALLLAAFTAFMVVGRLYSGVHWLTDIVGGILLATALDTAYAALCTVTQRKK
jgi:undecaprenyl-diphosphatase